MIGARAHATFVAAHGPIPKPTPAPSPRVHQFNAAIAVQHEHRIGKRRQRGFHRAMQPHDFFRRALPVGAQLAAILLNDSARSPSSSRAITGTGLFQVSLAQLRRRPRQ